MEKAKKYKKCPRCELNYIPEDEEYCLVCKAELKLTDELNDDLELCPICGVNFVSVDQPMCEECAKKRTLDDVVDEVDPSTENDEDWEEQKTETIDDLPADDDVELVSFSDLEDDEDDDDDDDDDDDIEYNGRDEFEDDFELDDDYDDDDEEDDDDDDDDDDDEDEEDD